MALEGLYSMQATVLLISCPDQPGIVARFTDALFKAGANLLSLEQLRQPLLLRPLVARRDR